MPVQVRQRNRMWRLLEPSGQLATTIRGRPVDGGGHKSKAQAEAQRRAIEAKKREASGWQRG